MENSLNAKQCTIFLFFIAAQKTPEEFKCPENDGNGNYADPATCRKFYQVWYSSYLTMSDLKSQHWPFSCG